MKRYPMTSDYKTPWRFEQHSRPTSGTAREGLGRGTVFSARSTEDLAALGKRIIAARHRRERSYAAELYIEPAREMLLALFTADASGHRMSGSAMTSASEAPAPTALRWIDKLEDPEMVRRIKNNLDERVFFIKLAPEARDIMTRRETAIGELLADGVAAAT